MAVDIRHNIEVVQQLIGRAAERSGRSAADVTLIAVTKTQPVGSIMAAMEAGVTDLGENRVQEALARFEAPGSASAVAGLVPRPGITLHLIGSLQRNKATAAVRHFDCIHSVDRVGPLGDLDAAAQERRDSDPLPVLLQVNLTGEPSKAGVAADDLPRLADALGNCAWLQGVGLMTIARMGADERELRATFSRLRVLLESLHGRHPGSWRHLSMGMSDDFEYAVEEGATMVRMGRALFGERPRPE